MQIQILAVGKIKEQYLAMGIDEYQKRLGSYAKLEIREVKDEKAPENASPAEQEQIVTKKRTAWSRLSNREPI